MLGLTLQVGQQLLISAMTGDSDSQSKPGMGHNNPPADQIIPPPPPNNPDPNLAGQALAIGAAAVLLGAGQQPQVTANRIAGNAFRDEIAARLRAEGLDVELEVYKRTPFGKRFIDIEVSKEGKVLGGIETKVGGSRYRSSQRVKDFWLWLDNYPVNVVRDR